MQHQLFNTTHAHTNYITSFLTILMPSSKTNSGIESSPRSQVYSTGPVCPIWACTYEPNEWEAKVYVCSLVPSQRNWPWRVIAGELQTRVEIFPSQVFMQIPVAGSANLFSPFPNILYPKTISVIFLHSALPKHHTEWTFTVGLNSEGT